MAYVVDIQCFKSLNNEFLLKEVCIIGVRNNFFYHAIIKPPVASYWLHKDFRRRVNFLTRYIHGLEWDWGWVDEASAITVLKEQLKNADKIYIKGGERVAFLEYKQRPVIDLDIFNYKGIDENKYNSCYYRFKRHSKLRCAMKKVLTYRDYLEKWKI